LGKILITGATGVVGKATIEHLLKKDVPASQIIGLARSSEKAEELLKKGVEIRNGDYFDYDSLLRAFVGVDKVMLILKLQEQRQKVRLADLEVWLNSTFAIFDECF
jgi:uncharacterized protein YbjT (DUF2867 family)